MVYVGRLAERICDSLVYQRYCQNSFVYGLLLINLFIIIIYYYYFPGRSAERICDSLDYFWEFFEFQASGSIFLMWIQIKSINISKILQKFLRLLYIGRSAERIWDSLVNHQSSSSSSKIMQKFLRLWSFIN